MTLGPPASADALAAAQKELRHPLPDDYARFLLRHNGGEGWVGEAYLMLDSVEELPAFQDPWGPDSEPFVVFGSDGANELFAFDARHNMAVFMIPGIGGPEHAIYCAETFTELLNRLHRGEELLAP